MDSTEKTKDNYEKLRKKYNLPFVDLTDDHHFDFNEGENYLKTAQQRANEFNSLPDNEVIKKNLCLANGAYNAYLATSCFYWIVSDYIKAGKLELDFDPTKYQTLKKEIFDMYPNRERWLTLMSAVITNYDRTAPKAAHNDDKDWRDIPIAENGLKAYHLKMLIEYCEKLKANIAKVVFASDPNTELINQLVDKGNNLLTAINICISKDFPEDVNQWSQKEMSRISKLCCEMYINYLNAFLLIYQKDFKVVTINSNYSDNIYLQLFAPIFILKTKCKSIERLFVFTDFDLIELVADGKRTVDADYLKGLIDEAISIATDIRYDLDINTEKNLPFVEIKKY